MAGTGDMLIHTEMPKWSYCSSLSPLFVVFANITASKNTRKDREKG
jgi:hypothetical protein